MGKQSRAKIRGRDLFSQIEWFNLNHNRLRLEITEHCRMYLKDVPNNFNRKCLIVFKIDEFRFHTVAHIPNEKPTDLTYLEAKNNYCEVYVVDYFLK